MWQNHTLLFDRLRAHDEVCRGNVPCPSCPPLPSWPPQLIVWLNLLLLMAVSFLPYTFTILGDFYHDNVSLAINVALFFAIAAVQGAMLLYTHRHPRLLREAFSRRRILARRRPQPYKFWHDLALAARILAMPLIFLAAYLLSFAH